MLDKLPILIERMSAMLVGFLDTVQAAHVSFLDEGAFEKWSEPTTRGTRRLAGITLDNVRNRHVIDAVVGLSTQPDGFTTAQLAEAVLSRSGWEADAYTKRHAACDLSKLRGKSLVDRYGTTRRYIADAEGVRTMAAYVILREHVIKPVLAGVSRRRGHPPKVISPLDRHYMTLRDDLECTFRTLGLAA